MVNLVCKDYQVLLGEQVLKVVQEIQVIQAI